MVAIRKLTVMTIAIPIFTLLLGLVASCVVVCSGSSAASGKGADPNQDPEAAEDRRYRLDLARVAGFAGIVAATMICLTIQLSFLTSRRAVTNRGQDSSVGRASEVSASPSPPAAPAPKEATE